MLASRVMVLVWALIQVLAVADHRARPHGGKHGMAVSSTVRIFLMLASFWALVGTVGELRRATALACGLATPAIS